MEMTPGGTPIATYTMGTCPCDMTVDFSGTVWVVDSTNNKVNALTTNKGIVKTYDVGLAPVGMVIDANGNGWVINAGSNTVTELIGITQGPQYRPYKGPQWIGSGNW